MTRLRDVLPFGHPARRSTPHEEELMSRLATLGTRPSPDPVFRAELRAQLVAATPRLVAEGSTPDAPARSRRRRSWLPAGARRPVTVLVSVAAVLLVLLGGTTWLAQRALPGDTLYGLKKASEDASLSLTHGDSARGQKYLQLAGTRIDEATDLVKRASSLGGPGPGSTGIVASGGVSARVQKLVADTVTDARNLALDGTPLLTTVAVQQMSKGPLTHITSWTATAGPELTALLQRLPTGAAHTATANLISTVASIDARAGALSKAMGCSCLSVARRDALGPLPCSVCSAPPGTPGPSTGPTSAPGTQTSTPGRSTASGSPTTRATTAPRTGTVPSILPTTGVGTTVIPTLPVTPPPLTPTKTNCVLVVCTTTVPTTPPPIVTTTSGGVTICLPPLCIKVP